jgi:hypothetical protein
LPYYGLGILPSRAIFCIPTLPCHNTKGKKGNKFHKFTFLKSIPGDLMKLVERMARMDKAVIKAKGGNFEESQI